MENTKLEIEIVTKNMNDFLKFFSDLKLFLGNHAVVMLVKELDFSSEEE